MPSSTMLSRLSARDLTVVDAQQLWAQLGDRAVDVRGQALELVRRHYVDSLRAFDKTRERVHKQARKLVPQCQREQLGRKGAAEVETLRGEALAVTRGPSLDKQAIHDAIDPRRQRLEELLLPSPTKLQASDPEFAAAITDLRAQLDATRAWFDLYLGGMHTLDEVPGGRRVVDRMRQEPDPPRADTIDADLEYLCLAALPMSGREQKALEQNARLRATMDSEEYLGTFELNRIRYALGLGLLAIDEKLGNAARDHASDMLRLGFFSHTSPVDGKHSFGERAARAGTSASAENIAAGQATGRGAIEGWWYSPGHHKNMLGGHNRTGLGRADNLWTQMFGG
ncbi:MAG: CAP domain-containing protein [Planctomycetes bacterium]|nr:CAP domain-containing protein [Planctomycetota bacterium]